jgi:uncharacterized sulfatase
MDVHAPHHPPARHLAAFDRDPPDWDAHHDQWLAAKADPSGVTDEEIRQFIDVYDAEIRFVDEQISHLFDQMERLGFHEETLYIITADHGELLGEHGSFSHPPRLYEELLHVPLLLHRPCRTDGRRVDELVSLIDLPTTVADALAVSVPETYRGNSLFPALEGESPGHEYVFAEVCHRVGEGMSAGAYDPDKVIVSCRSPAAEYVRDEQLDRETFTAVDASAPDAEVPPGERESLRQAANDHLRSIETRDSSFERADIDEATAKRLRDLGYAE